MSAEGTVSLGSGQPDISLRPGLQKSNKRDSQLIPVSSSQLEKGKKNRTSSHPAPGVPSRDWLPENPLSQKQEAGRIRRLGLTNPASPTPKTSQGD